MLCYNNIGDSMNVKKKDRIREEIITADRVFYKVKTEMVTYIRDKMQLLHDNNLETIFLESFLSSNISERDKKSILNEMGERLSFACEHYLKSLIIPRMHFSDIPEESDDELNKIFEDKNKGIKKYSHYFKKLLLETTIIPNEIKNQIIMGVALSLDKEEIQKEQNDYWKKSLTIIIDPKASLEKINERSDAIDKSRDKLIEKAKEIIIKNDDAYPQSRYGMFTNYIADIKFLYIFCGCLNKAISLAFSNCINELNTHIFFDSNSTITKVYENGVTDVFNVDKDGKVLPSYIEDMHDICSIDTGRGDLLPIEFHYKENNTYKVLKLDERLGQYISEISSSELEVKKTNSI